MSTPSSLTAERSRLSRARALAGSKGPGRPAPGSGKAPRYRARVAPKVRRNASAYGFLIGAVLCFTFFSWYPIVREVIMSFQKPVYGGGYAWDGWKNYVR